MHVMAEPQPLGTIRRRRAPRASAVHAARPARVDLFGTPYEVFGSYRTHYAVCVMRSVFPGIVAVFFACLATRALPSLAHNSSSSYNSLSALLPFQCGSLEICDEFLEVLPVNLPSHLVVGS